MNLYYLSIKNKLTNALNHCGPNDPTASLLKVTGTIPTSIFEQAVFVVENGVLLKKNGQYPKCNVGEKLSEEALVIMENNYSKTTTKQYDTFEKILNIMVNK